MKTCGECIYWQKVKSIKNYGNCTIPIPPWVIIDGGEDIIYKHSKIAEGCEYFREEQEEFTIAELLSKIDSLEHRLYCAKVQESLTRHIVEG